MYVNIYIQREIYCFRKNEEEKARSPKDTNSDALLCFPSSGPSTLPLIQGFPNSHITTWDWVSEHKQGVSAAKGHVTTESSDSVCKSVSCGMKTKEEPGLRKQWMYKLQITRRRVTAAAVSYSHSAVNIWKSNQELPKRERSGGS